VRGLPRLRILGCPFIPSRADSSGIRNRAVLSQMRDATGGTPSCSSGKSLSPAERNYNICDKEMLASSTHWNSGDTNLGRGATPVQVLTDHKTLSISWDPLQKLNRRQARWSTYLSHFDLNILRIDPGNLVPTRPLSRRVDHRTGVADDNDNCRLAKNPEFSRTEFDHLCQPLC